MSSASYEGAYINLDRSAARRQAIESQLQGLGLSTMYRRVSAVDGKALPRHSCGTLTPGEAGVFRSHANLLAEAGSRNRAVHVIEDDVILSRHTQDIIEQAIAAGYLEEFDFILLDTFVQPDLGMLKFLGQAFSRTMTKSADRIGLEDFQIVNVSRQNFAGTASYVVGPKGIAKMVPLLSAELRAGPRSPLDLFVRQCAGAGKLKAGMLAPFLTSINLEQVQQTTIGASAPGSEYSVTVLAALRYLFFIDRDLQLARHYLNLARRLRPENQTATSELVMEVVEFILSDEYRSF